jgi:uncharacterized protein YceK
MRALPTAAVVALAALCASGCGTILNLASGDPQIYGGPQADITIALTPNTAPGDPPAAAWPEGSPIAEGISACWPFLLLLADVPLSLVGDTVTLPLAISMRQNKHPRADPPALAGGVPAAQGLPQPVWPEVVNVDGPGGAAHERP